MTGFAEFIAGMRGDPSEGRTLGQVLTGASRSSWYDREEPAPDPDDKMSALLTRGYRPGELQRLSLALGEVQAELEAERAKIARTERRMQLLMRDQAAGRISAFDVMRMAGGDDDGDPGRVEMLERRLESLQRQTAEMASRAARAADDLPQDPLEAASRQAHRVFVEATRARMAAAEAGMSRREPRPFGSSRALASRAAAVRGEMTCADCIKYGASAEESFMIHHEPHPEPVPPGWKPPEDAPWVPFRDDEVGRLTALGYSPEAARLAATPVISRSAAGGEAAWRAAQARPGETVRGIYDAVVSVS